MEDLALKTQEELATRLKRLLIKFYVKVCPASKTNFFKSPLDQYIY